jgi:hypothetical protein
MGKRDGEYIPACRIELDEGYFFYGKTTIGKGKTVETRSRWLREGW